MNGNITEIKTIKRDDWVEHQICGDFPIVDTRCLIFCCSPLKPCPLRNIVLKEMGLTIDDYIKIKEKTAENFERRP